MGSVAFSGDGQQLTSASISQEVNKDVLPGQVILWDVAKASKIREITHDSSYVKLSHDGSRTGWVSSKDNKIVLVDIRRRGKPLALSGYLNSFLCSPHNTLLSAPSPGARI